MSKTVEEIVNEVVKQKAYDIEKDKDTASARAQILHMAEDCICRDRETQYGSPEESFQAIADLWNAYFGTDIFTADKVAVAMALMKFARIKTGTFKLDSFVDAIGYLACAGEIAERTND